MSQDERDAAGDKPSKQSPINIPGLQRDADSSRQEGNSEDEGADSIPEGATSMKRQRAQTPSPTRSGGTGHPSVMVPSSPPKFVSMEEIMQAAGWVSNMSLAHEIAVDSEFRLEKSNQPSSSLDEKVKEIIHKAFWDSLQEKLREDPPDYSQALVLLQEVKETLLSLLLPHHQRLKGQIDEILDLELIEQQADNGALDFHYYADFVVSLISKICAPIRDESVAKLKDVKDVVPLFKEIFTVMDLMKIDMANFTIQQMRPFIQKQSVDYERAKFEQILKVQQENNMDGLQYTKEWLIRNFNKVPPGSSTEWTKTLNEAYLELLMWDPEPQQLYPETLLMDQGRYTELLQKTQRLTLIAGILLVTYNTVGGPIVGVKGFKDKLKKEIVIIFGDESVSKLPDLMPNVADQMNKEVNECMKQHGFPVPDERRQELLKGQVKEVIGKDHPVHQIIKTRIFGFIRDVISSPDPRQLQIPPGLGSVAEELSQISGRLISLVSHNKAVFSSYYRDILDSLLQAKNMETAGETSSHKSS